MLSDVLIGGSYLDYFSSFDGVIDVLRSVFPFFAGVAFSFLCLRLIFLAFFCE